MELVTMEKTLWPSASYAYACAYARTYVYACAYAYVCAYAPCACAYA